MVEGAKLLGEARAAGARIDTVFLDNSRPARPNGTWPSGGAEDGIRVVEVQAGVLARACDTVTPQPVAAIVGTVDLGLAELGERRPDLVVVCSDIRDPGNLGTIIRSAGAAGAGGVVCCAGSVDLFNPKTVRASAGMLFHVPVVVAGQPGDVLDELGRWGLRRWGTAAQSGCDYVDADLTAPTALVLGNEAHGLARLARRPPGRDPAHPDGWTGGVAQRGDGGLGALLRGRPAAPSTGVRPRDGRRARALTRLRTILSPFKCSSDSRDCRHRDRPSPPRRS